MRQTPATRITRPYRRLTDEQAREAIDAYRAGRSVRDIARGYGVCIGVIYGILDGTRYRHILRPGDDDTSTTIGDVIHAAEFFGIPSTLSGEGLIEAAEALARAPRIEPEGER
jgi:hypothetical protein